MTVAELLKQLRAQVKADPKLKDAKVVLEGCDCYGDWNGKIEVDPSRKDILLCR